MPPALATPDLSTMLPFAPGMPFSTAHASAAGIDRSRLTRLVASGRLRRMLRSVYVDALSVETMELRLAALRLVVPPDGVVVDETAAWLLGATTALEPNAHLLVPEVHVFQATSGRRLRNVIVTSGERAFLGRDVVELSGVLVTTPIRTALDLGRLRSRDRAIVALDALLRLARFAGEELQAETPRFRGQRGVVQLRELAPLADGRSESPGESILRLRWLDAGIPAPEPQLEVAGPGRSTFRFDLGLEKYRFAAEYDGEKFHTAPEDVAHDVRRRGWMRDQEGWVICVARRHNLFGRTADAHELLRHDFQQALERAGGRSS